MTIPDWLAEPATARLDGWKADIETLLATIEGWCAASGWPVRHESTDITEDGLGTYTVPSLHARLPNRVELYVTPVALRILGADGRVDVEVWPALNRVKLVRRHGSNQWDVWTDANVRLESALTQESFVSMVRNLAAVPG